MESPKCDRCHQLADIDQIADTENALCSFQEERVQVYLSGHPVPITIVSHFPKLLLLTVNSRKFV